MVETRGATAWTKVRDAIGPQPPRPRYARAFRALASKDHAPRAVLALAARVASDAPARRVLAPFFMAWHALALAVGA
jgi:hypothetical protein